MDSSALDMDSAPGVASGRILALRCRQRSRGCPGCAVSASQRKLQPKRSSHSNRALHMHLARMLLHDAIANRQAKSSAFVLAIAWLGLGGEERIEDAMQMFRLDPSAKVLHYHGDEARRLL